MKPNSPTARRPKAALIAGLVSAGVALASLVAPAGAADPDPGTSTTVDAATTTTVAPTTAAPTTMPPTTEPPTTVAPLVESAELGAPSRQGCVLTVPVTVGAAGTYTLDVWDDAVQVGAVSKDFTAGQSGAFSYTITQNVGTEAVGLDFVVDGPTADDLAALPGWDFPNSDRVMQFCEDSGGASDSAKPPTAQAKPAGAVRAKPTFTG